MKREATTILRGLISEGRPLPSFREVPKGGKTLIDLSELIQNDPARYGGHALA